MDQYIRLPTEIGDRLYFGHRPPTRRATYPETCGVRICQPPPRLAVVPVPWPGRAVAPPARDLSQVSTPGLGSARRGVVSSRIARLHARRWPAGAAGWPTSWRKCPSLRAILPRAARPRQSGPGVAVLPPPPAPGERHGVAQQWQRDLGDVDRAAEVRHRL